MDFDGMDLAPALARLYGRDLPEPTLRKLQGDASTRAYYRVTVPRPPRGTPPSVVVMRLPEDALASEEATGEAVPSELPFLNVHRLLSGRGVPVPAILVEDLERGVLLLEDLGDRTFERSLRDTDRSEWHVAYERAVDLLAELHERCEAGAPDSLAHGRRFDHELLRWELDHFREWGLEAVHGPLPPDERARLDALLDGVAEEVRGLPEGFVHRDYQSRNLMWRADDSLVVLDFQDALRGPRVYDLVALLCDSYVAVDTALQRSMIARYARRRELSAEALEQEFQRVAVQRKLKDAGRFVYIDRIRGNPGFLSWYGPSLAHVGRALARLGGPPWDPLEELLSHVLPGFPDRIPPPAPLSGGGRKKIDGNTRGMG